MSSSIDSTIDGSRRRLRAFWLERSQPNTISSPCTTTHTTETWGVRSALHIHTWATASDPNNAWAGADSSDNEVVVDIGTPIPLVETLQPTTTTVRPHVPRR